MVSNLTSFSEALGKNSGKVDAILAGLERMTGGGKTAGLVYTFSALPASAAAVKPLEKQLAIPDPSALLTYDFGARFGAADGDRTRAAWKRQMGRQPDEAHASEDRAELREHRLVNEVSRPIEGGAPEFQLSTEIRKFQIVRAGRTPRRRSVRRSLRPMAISWRPAFLTGALR